MLLIKTQCVTLLNVCLSGCEVAPDVNVAAQKFLIRLLIPAPEGMNEVYLRCENVRPNITVFILVSPQSRSCISSLLLCLMPVFQEQQYAQWMAGCRLASKGKSLADSSFQSEIQSIRSFLAMQKTNSGSSNNAASSDESINTHSLVSPRYHKKYKPKQVEEETLFAPVQDRQYLLFLFAPLNVFVKKQECISLKSINLNIKASLPLN